MKKIAVALLLLLLTLPLWAVDSGEVKYVGGSVAAMKEGTVGRLNTTSPSALTFESPGCKLVIPYAAINSYEYSQALAHQLGILPAIAVGLAKHRQRRHYFRISFQEGDSPSQVVIFEVPKQMPHTLLAVLRVRAPQGCHALAKCGGLDN